MSSKKIVFFFNWQIAKEVPVFKKDSKLDYKRYLYSITIISSIMYSLDSEKQYFRSHTFINLTENIRKPRDDGNLGCEVFVDLQKLLIR